MNEIAIIGMSGRFPGSRNVGELWEKLCAGKSAVAALSDRELAERNVPPETVNNPNYVKAAAIVEDIDKFDADFFGYSPKEAETTDPQHRLLLECAWEALENAGCVPERFDGSIGVFVGGSLSTYLLSNLLTGIGFDSPVDNIPVLIGNDKDYLATRLSYKLNLKGPSVSIQTACSSSLVAVHTACQSLLNGECDAALAGGVTLRIPQDVGYFYQEGGYLSPDGRCKAFADEADGTIFGNGVGVVVLKRLSDAIADGDRIEAVIKGSAVNNDGAAKVGFTAPSVEGQIQVISEALSVAEVNPETISLIEAHGTGTPLGDPIEITALSQVFRAVTDRKQFCAIGSIKTNLGHLESAAGVTGLIKTVLALKHKMLPPSLNCQTPSSRINFPDTPFFVNTRLQEWKTTAFAPVRRAAVSSFGIGGTNAHIILEEYSSAVQSTTNSNRETENSSIFILSAPTEKALHGQAANVRRWLETRSGDETLFEDVCYTLGQRRKHHPYRLTFAANGKTDCLEKIGSYLHGEITPGVFTGKAVSGNASVKPVFVFSGQGAQWWGMGRWLLDSEPVFRQTLEKCEAEVQKCGGWSVMKEFLADQSESLIDGNNIEITQVALCCLQIALAEVWKSYGIQPAAVIGHSMGEVAAAYVAGALDLRDAVKVILTRSRLLQSATQKGAMAAIELPVEEIVPEIRKYSDYLGIAACNSTSSTVVSGDAAAVDELVSKLEERGVMCRLLRTTGVAGHSPQVEPQRVLLVEALSDIQPRSSDVPMVSTNTGHLLDGRSLNAEYWGKNLRESVLFAQGIKELIAVGHTVFLEISPHPILVGAISESLQDAECENYLVLHSLRRFEEEQAFRSVQAQLLANGYPCHQTKLFPAFGRCVETPAYAWQRERYWIDPKIKTAAKNQSAVRQFPKTEKNSTGLDVQWIESSLKPETFISEVLLDADEQTWLKDHTAVGETIVPAAFYLSWAFQASQMLFQTDGFVLRDFRINAPLILTAEAKVKLQFAVEPDESGKSFAFKISSYDAVRKERWIGIAEGILSAIDVTRTEYNPEEIQKQSELIKARRRQAVDSAEFYTALERVEIQYGKYFQTLDKVSFNQHEAFARLRADEAVEIGQVPTVFQFDGLLQTMLPLCSLSGESDSSNDRLMLPISIERMTCRFSESKPFGTLAQIIGTVPTTENVQANLTMFDENYHAIATIENLQVAPLEVPRSRHSKSAKNRELTHRVSWTKRDGGKSFETQFDRNINGLWLILADQSGIGDHLKNRLEEKGNECEIIRLKDCDLSLGIGALSDFLQSKIAGRSERLCGVVHLWNLDQFTTAQQFSFDEMRQIGCDSAAALFQTLNKVDKTNYAPRCWFVTKKSRTIENFDNGAVDITQSLTWGLVRVAGYEFPELAPTLCDLSEEPLAGELDNLFAEIWSNRPEREIAFRREDVFTAKLVKAELSEDKHDDLNSKYRSDGTYLITGGFGGLGLATAAHLIAKDAGNIILIGRNQPDEAAQQAIEKLREKGVRISAFVADITDLAAITSILAEVKMNFPPLRGIIQAAGVLSDSVIDNLDASRLQRVLLPKVLGTWNLHNLTLDAELDFFVFYSSVAAMLGSPGQAAHAAANAFLDALAYHRRALNLTALSINWGPWRDAGKASNNSLSRTLTERGLDGISSADAFEIFDRLLAAEAAQMGVFNFEPQKWTEYYPHLKDSGFLSELASTSDDAVEEAKPEKNLSSDLLAVAPRERRNLLLKTIKNQAAKVLGMNVERLDSKVPLQNYGLDSLRALEFRNALEKLTSRKISAVVCWKYPTVEQLSVFLGQLLEVETEVSQLEKPKSENKQPIADFNDVMNLSEAETLDLLQKKLEVLR